MAFTFNTRITLTPAAHAVLHAPTFQDQQHRRFQTLCAPGDLVAFPGCQATFQVFSRKWTVAESEETLEVMLDLLPSDEPLLSAVK